MKPSDSSQEAWSINYCDFFLRKARRFLLLRAEMSKEKRPFPLFSLTNDVMATQIRSGGTYEPEVLGMISHLCRKLDLKHGIALDIGANIGNHCIWMAKQFKEVIAFEPDPMIASVLKANCLLNGCDNVAIEQVALAESPGEGVLQQQSPEHIGTLELIDPSTALGAAGPRVSITIDTGDNVLSRHAKPEPRIAFIKIDVEGAEPRALKGLSTHIRKSKPVICFESRNSQEGEAVMNVLLDLGYTHYYALVASRFGIRSLFSIWRRSTWKKHYRLVPVSRLENRHYSAVVANCAALD